MLNSVRVFFQGEFNRNVVTLMTGTGLAQLIPLAVTPILSRLYPPEQFGVLALFVSVVSSLSALATGRYEFAIMLPRKDVDATNIAAMSITINLIVSVALFAVACIFGKSISNALGNESMSIWLYVVPLAVFLNGIYANLKYWSNRHKLYFLMAHRQVLQSGGTSAVQLGLGLLRVGAGGLVTGSVAGQALATGMMAGMVRRHCPHFWRGIDRRKMLALAKRYRSCPQYLVPAHTLGAVSVQLPTIFINAAFGLAASGFFMLAERVIGMPLSLISGSIGDVFRQEINDAFLAGNRCREIFISTLKKLVAVATPPFVVLLFFAPSLFSLVFGEKWRVAGEYARLMCPMFYLRFISNPLSLVAIIAQKNRFEFWWQVGMLLFLMIVAATHYLIRLDVKMYIAGFVIIYSVFDLANLFASYKFACDGDLRKPVSRAP
ncbi:oligosaccharide flippase family protein [Telluria mixta]|uniref:Oligosaccharide flippase family protein n=1 Tax=Telluria mixta TaxID=34071 RepID=A0ABT2C4D7_9BURK|nr:oligosaccharide flippase family protein [Telluria mixta]MCS0632258.1 oligosaccharide flippase family protein [Telluria mixta]WEM94985.1 oligosaccharide flippase family protein [Telluria mixta]